MRLQGEGGVELWGGGIENLFQCTEQEEGVALKLVIDITMTNLLFFRSSDRSFQPFPLLMSARSFKFLPKILLIFPKPSTRGALIVPKLSARGSGAVLWTEDGENCKSLLCLLERHYFLLFSNYTLCLKYGNFIGLGGECMLFKTLVNWNGSVYTTQLPFKVMTWV